MDLLFVGGTHGPNRQGLASFVAECFIPYLQPKGVNLVVAGDVGTALWPDKVVPPGITCLGRVADLRPLYAAAKLVIVPLIEGTGVSIKTLEAISLGKPVLSSPAGLRGIRGAPGFGIDLPFDRRWADAIERLLGNRHARRVLRHSPVESARQITLDDVLLTHMETIFGGKLEGRLAKAPAFRQSPNPLVEWVGDPRFMLAILADPDRDRQHKRADLIRLLMDREAGCLATCEDIADDLVIETGV